MPHTRSGAPKGATAAADQSSYRNCTRTESEPPAFWLTQHAHARCRQMAVELTEVLATVRTPESQYPSLKYPGQVIATRGRLAVPVDPATGAVITVLWSGRSSRYENWSRYS